MTDQPGHRTHSGAVDEQVQQLLEQLSLADKIDLVMEDRNRAG